MNSQSQKDALAVLAEVWALAPDVRLGQLWAHPGFLGEIHVGKGLGYIDDDEMVAVLYRHRAELLARGHETPHRGMAPAARTSVSGSSTLAQPVSVPK